MTRYLQFLTVISIFIINSTNGDDTNVINELKKILKELNGQSATRYDETNYNYKVLNHPRHYRPPKSSPDSYSPNLMNVQTMNLFMKPNKRQQEEADLKKILRGDTERKCKAPGRCGCSGTRCGKENKDDIADEVDRVVNEINEHLTNNDDELNNNRFKLNLYEDRDKKLGYDDERNNYRDEINRQRDGDDHEFIMIKMEKKFDEDHDGIDSNLEDIINKPDRENFFKNKKATVNDNLEMVILDEADLDVLLRNKDFIDLTRNDKHNTDDDSEGENNEIFNKILKEYKQIVTKENKADYRTSNVVTPEEFFGYYDTVKQELVVKVLNYVKDKNLSSSLKIKHISPYQKNRLRSVKLKYRRGDLRDDGLEEEIVKILFGNQSNMRIVPQNENNNKIYVPQWIYENVLNSKNLRAQQKISQSRILPLTIQQKERLTNKEKGKKTIPKLVWRKNAGQNVQEFGIPFNFEVHGLGQMAP